MAIENEAPAVVISPVAVATDKGGKNKDGFVKGQVVGSNELLSHLAKERQKKK